MRRQLSNRLDTTFSHSFGLAATSLLIIGAAAIALLINASIRLMRLWSDGVVIDARGDTIIVKKDPALPRGTLIVISKQNERTEFDKVEDLDVTKIISSLGGERVIVGGSVRDARFVSDGDQGLAQPQGAELAAIEQHGS